jgi:hypothetical protein
MSFVWLLLDGRVADMTVEMKRNELELESGSCGSTELGFTRAYPAPIYVSGG